MRQEKDGSQGHMSPRV